MKGLIYISRAMQPLSEEQLKTLAKQASAKNKKLGVTGYLSYDDDNQFIQYIEGEDEIINTLFDSIYKDQRHRITHYVKHDIDERKFANWNMRLILDNEFKQIHDLMINHLFHITSAPSMLTYKNKLIWTTVEALSEAAAAN